MNQQKLTCKYEIENTNTDKNSKVKKHECKKTYRNIKNSAKTLFLKAVYIEVEDDELVRRWCGLELMSRLIIASPIHKAIGRAGSRKKWRLVLVQSLC